MTEKVKLTREQAEAVEAIKSSSLGNDGTILEFVRACGISNHVFHLDELIKSLYIGYEVEETFKVGDWVMSSFFGYAEGRALKIQQITKRKDKTYVYFSNLEAPNHNCYIEDICRHATPEEIAEEKQRRWWAKHGRKPWELKIGDIIKKLCSPYDFEALEISGMDDRYIYAKDNYIINPKTTQMDVNYRVVCFAEDRKDVQA